MQQMLIEQTLHLILPSDSNSFVFMFFRVEGAMCTNSNGGLFVAGVVYRI